MAPESSIELCEKPLFSERYLIVDGPPRVGKMFASKLITNLAKVEFAQIEPMIENVAIIWRMGLIDERTASGMIQNKLDNLFYDRAVGRHMNTRPDDIMSIHMSLDHENLLKRSNMPDGNQVMYDLLEDGHIFSLVGHDMVPNQRLFFKAFPGLQFIHIVRHPVATVYSWFHRGWGKRYGVDPRAFSPAFTTSQGPIPWWAVEWQDEYFALSEMDRCIRGFLTIDEAYNEGIRTMAEDKRPQLLSLNYEGLVIQPEQSLEKAAAFLKTELHPQISVALARENVPVKITTGHYKERLDLIASKATPECLELLRQASDQYEATWNLKELISES